MLQEKTEKEILEKALSILVDELKKEGVKIQKKTSDARGNSAANEDDVVDIIKNIASDHEYFINNNLTVGTPNLGSNNNRAWYDFSIESKDTSKSNYFIPINIKITEVDKGAADNLSCKLGLFYALTGCLPKSVSIGQGTGWEKFFSAADKHMAKDKTKDYYFLVVSKNDSKDIFWNSLRCLSTLTPNGSNLPFQCKWGANRERIERTYLQARDFMLGCLHESILKQAVVADAFELHMKKYIGLKTDLVVEETPSEQEDN